MEMKKYIAFINKHTEMGGARKHGYLIDRGRGGGTPKQMHA